MTLYLDLASGLVVIVLACYSDNPRSSPDREPNLGFALSIMSYFFSKVKDRENYHNLNLLEFDVVEEYGRPGVRPGFCFFKH
jgi:hypothetical protein